ncbi:hypothetical protein [Magnetovibrio sp.]|uniref:hypothetical protein n=1 Tax=Magnetovibrio sp. TaxID=2024836 RepID=UPI002F920338
MDAGKRIDDLLFITNGLADLLEQENAALRSNRLDVVQNLLERKTTLSRAYEIRVFGMKQELEHEQAQYDEVDHANLERLKDVGARVAVLIEENEKMLKVALEVSRRFMACVADSAKHATPGTGAYSAKGDVGTQASIAHKQATSLALDETL